MFPQVSSIQTDYRFRNHYLTPCKVLRSTLAPCGIQRRDPLTNCVLVSFLTLSLRYSRSLRVAGEQLYFKYQVRNTFAFRLLLIWLSDNTDNFVKNKRVVLKDEVTLVCHDTFWVPFTSSPFCFQLPSLLTLQVPLSYYF